MSLQQKPSVEPAPKVLEDTPGADVRRRGPRWLGVLFVGFGALFLSLAAGDALAGTRLGGVEDDVMRVSKTATVGGEEHLAGMAGADVIYGGASDDSLSGGAGDDEIYGGEGSDLLLGGTGDDFIEAADGVRDMVGCGPGADVVSADGEDLVASDCETVYVS